MDNTLRKIKDEATIIQLLHGAKEATSEMYIWRMVGNTKSLGSVRIESIRKLRKDFCIIPADGQERVVQDLMGSQNHIDIYVPDSGLLLRCIIKHTEAPVRYYLQFPQFVAQVERRKNLRLNVHTESNVKVTFSKTASGPRPMTQHFFKDCFDISSGGFSMLVSKMESKFFAAGDAITLIDLKTTDMNTKVAGEVTLIREVEPDEFNGLTYKVWRVSCKFTQIDQISKKYLDKFILERIKEELRAINE